MRMTRWLRFGLASIVVAGTGLGATLVACSDDPAPGGTTPTPEAGTAETSTPADSGGGTDAADAAKPDAGTLAKLTLVNATTDMGPNSPLNARGDAAIRVCFKQGTTTTNLGVAPYPPLPDKKSATSPAGTPPGIFYGTGGTFPSFGLDLEGRIIVPIVMNARTLLLKGIVNPGTGSPGTTCDELVGATTDAGFALEPFKDFWELPAIPLGTFKKEKAFVLLLTGCVADATITNPLMCGPGFTAGGPGVGNLAVQIFETTRAPVSATSLGIQFLHGSSQLNATFGPSPGADFPIEPGLMADPTDAGSFNAATATAAAYATLSPAKAVTKTSDADYFVLSKTQPDPSKGPLAPFPLTTIQALSGLGAPSAPTVYVNGKNFVFIAVGEPGQPTFNDPDGGGAGDGGDGTSFNTKSPHYLAFPTDPTVTAYAP